MDPRDAFISYIEEDGPTARALAQELRVQGQSTWTYEEDGVAGISYLTQVHHAIESCRAFVLIASTKSVHAHQVICEVEQAHEREKMIIAVRVGLTHQQFISENPILRMATGTAVTLFLGEGSVPSVATHIARGLSSLRQGGPTPTAPEKPTAPSAATPSLPSPVQKPKERQIEVLANSFGEPYLERLVLALKSALKKRQEADRRMHGLSIVTGTVAQSSVVVIRVFGEQIVKDSPSLRLAKTVPDVSKVSRKTKANLFDKIYIDLCFSASGQSVTHIGVRDAMIKMTGHWTTEETSDILLSYIVANI
jgi:hypothetical protein